MKRCSKCGVEKEIVAFPKDRSRSDGLFSWCKVCNCENVKAWQRNNVYKKRKIGRMWAANHPEASRKWREQNSEKVKKFGVVSSRKWRERNPEKVRAQSKRYGLAHREQINGRDKMRRRSDINFRLAGILRTRLRSAVLGKTRPGSSVRDLGCTVEELRTRLESLWLPGMSWLNYGRNGWHIDHILPLSSFDLTDSDQFRCAVHYSNLQPLWAHDNFVKNNRIVV